MAHTKGHIMGKKVLEELKTWTKPTKGIKFTPFKAAYSLGKTAFRHPVLSTAAYFLGKKLLKKTPGLKFPKHRQFDKRGRKFPL
jgi:hypothetical protein